MGRWRRYACRSSDGDGRRRSGRPPRSRSAWPWRPRPLLVSTVAFRASGLAPDNYVLGSRELTAFIARPDGMALVVAVLAGIVGMLSLTEGRSGALVGVLVSVTTIPAAANVGVAAAYGAWSEVRGAAAQLVLNLTGLLVAGVLTLVVQARTTRSSP